MFEKVLTFVRREPIRALLYPLLLSLVAVLVTKGVLDGNSAPVVLAVVSAVLAVPAAEVARSQVTPVAK